MLENNDFIELNQGINSSLSTIVNRITLYKSK